MSQPFEYFDEEPKEGGVSYATLLSIGLHVVGFAYFLFFYHPIRYTAPQPRLRYVELVSQQQQEKRFVEAPGDKVATAKPEALLSDANRHAASPHPTAGPRTLRPGLGGEYDPGSPAVSRQSASSGQQQQQADGRQSQSRSDGQPLITGNGRDTISAASAAPIDWKSAIRQAGEMAQASYNASSSASGSGSMGGESGGADTGAVSFETAWFDWGDYAQGMVAKIKVNWYGLMPEIIKTGMRGVVTIRFTIHRDGSISDITVLKSSGVPPYDFAAMKALERSSALAHLPANFPKESERVTAMFYYNTPIR